MVFYNRRFYFDESNKSFYFTLCKIIENVIFFDEVAFDFFLNGG